MGQDGGRWIYLVNLTALFNSLKYFWLEMKALYCMYWLTFAFLAKVCSFTTIGIMELGKITPSLPLVSIK